MKYKVKLGILLATAAAVLVGCKDNISVILPSNSNSIGESISNSQNSNTITPSTSTSTKPSNSVSSSTSTKPSTTPSTSKDSTSIDVKPSGKWTYDNKDNYYNYDDLNRSEGKELKTKLFKTIGTHTEIGYKSLATVYRDSDARSDGTVWDIYGDFSYSFSDVGNYKNEGDTWNKEHSMPKSWFKDAKPMYSDAFHIYPSDGKINGYRSNHPYGEVGSATYTYITKNQAKTGITLTNKLGKSSISGYSGTVFEPGDIYKGDFARSYFYMVTAYEDKVASWQTGNTNLGGTSYPGLNVWSLEMMLRWSLEDPVSQKEIDRNNAIYGHQHNRNPYIDNDSLACSVFGNYNSNTKQLCASKSK